MNNLDFALIFLIVIILLASLEVGFTFAYFSLKKHQKRRQRGGPVTAAASLKQGKKSHINNAGKGEEPEITTIEQQSIKTTTHPGPEASDSVPILKVTGDEITAIPSNEIKPAQPGIEDRVGSSVPPETGTSIAAADITDEPLREADRLELKSSGIEEAAKSVSKSIEKGNTLHSMKESTQDEGSVHIDEAESVTNEVNSEIMKVVELTHPSSNQHGEQEMTLNNAENREQFNGSKGIDTKDQGREEEIYNPSANEKGEMNFADLFIEDTEENEVTKLAKELDDIDTSDILLTSRNLISELRGKKPKTKV